MTSTRTDETKTEPLPDHGEAGKYVDALLSDSPLYNAPAGLRVRVNLARCYRQACEERDDGLAHSALAYAALRGKSVGEAVTDAEADEGAIAMAKRIRAERDALQEGVRELESLLKSRDD